MSAIRDTVTGWVDRNSGGRDVKRCHSWKRSKKAGTARGSKPARWSSSIPVRSASISFSREYESAACCAPAALAARVACPAWGSWVAIRIPANTPARVVSEASRLRSMSWARCRWVTWAISCAITAASSLSDSVITMSPAFTAMIPPGPANALTLDASTTRNRYRRSGSALAMRCPRESM